MSDAPTTPRRLFLVDGYALIYRSYYAFINRPLTNSAGENTSAAWGIANFLIGVLEEHRPDYLAVVFDAGRSQREAIFPDYKATREKMPDELRAGLPRIRELVEAFHGPVVEMDGFEADDVIGTLAEQARAQGVEVVIVSGDKDFYQLIRPGISLLNPGRGGPTGVAEEWVTTETASSKFGVAPTQVVDYLALVGDSSDNVPGAPGVGPKTAAALLESFGSLDELIARADEVTGKRAREALTDHVAQVLLSRELVTIGTDVPVDVPLDALAVQEPDRERLRELFLELEFRTLVDKLGLAGDPSEADTIECRVVDTVAEVDRLVRELRQAARFSLRAVSGGPRAIGSRLAGLAIAHRAGGAAYLPFDHRPSGGLELDLGLAAEIDLLPPLADLDGLRDLLENPDVPKVGHDLKETVLALRGAGVSLGGISTDAMVASYVIDPSRRHHDLLALASERLGVALPARKDLVGTGQSEISFHGTPVVEAADFVGRRAELALRLADRFEQQLESTGLATLFEELETPLIGVLSRMEARGIRIDEAFFRDMSVRLGRELGGLQSDIFKAGGREFNINSTPQLREILFDELGLPVLKRTKTGPSTDVTVLEELAAEGHELPRLLMEYRQLEKLRSTYVDALPRLVLPSTGRIHTRFNQAVAATGRLSSSEPNLQNIPIRTSLGREIRRGFVADDGNVLLSVDYSQVELRVLAHFSGDQAFLDAFRSGRDVHVQTAAVIFGVDADDVSPVMRAQAKTINFATIYGQGDFSLARQLGIARTEARAFIDAYFERFSGVRAFLDEQIRLAKDRGFVETLTGRRRYVPELRSSNWNTRAFGERVAQNTPIQGTAADLIKKAMIDVDRALTAGEFESRLLLQVHDELVLEVPGAELATVEGLVVQHMEGAMDLAVPLVAESGSGRSWYDCKG